MNNHVVWKKKKLGLLTTNIQYGMTVASKKTGSVKLLRITDIQDGNVSWEQTPFCICSEGDFAKYKLLDGDIVFARTGATTGKSFLIKHPPVSVFASYLIRIQCNQEILPDFLNLFFNSDYYWNNIDKQSRGGTLAGFNASMLSVLEVIYPESLEYQEKIINGVQSQLAHIESMRQAALKQKEAAKALQSAILREVFPWQAGESLPSGWRWEKIPNISKNLDGKRIPVAEKLRQKGDIPYYGASGIVDHVQDYLFDEELLLVSEDGANLVMRTYPIAFSISGKTWVNNHAHVLKFEDQNTQKIVQHYINGLDISDYVSGAAQPKLNQENLNRIKIPMPIDANAKLEVVKKIEQTFEISNKMTKQADTQLNAIEALPAAILREAFAFQ